MIPELSLDAQGYHEASHLTLKTTDKGEYIFKNVRPLLLKEFAFYIW